MAILDYGDINDENNNDDATSDVEPPIVPPEELPDLAIDKSHTTDFVAGEQGEYTISVTNVSERLSDAPITVMDTVPEELTVITVSGDGWACSVADQTVTCESSTALEPGQSRNITVLVQVSESAAPEVVNMATVESPVDGNASNDSDSDPTDVVIPEPEDRQAIWDGTTDPGLRCSEECASSSVFFPWVAAGDDFGLGPADTSITIQNLETRDSYLFIYRGIGEGLGADGNGWELTTTAYLSGQASKTFDVDDLGIEPGQGAPIAVAGYHEVQGDGGACDTNIGGIIAPGEDVNDNDQCSDVELEVERDGGDTVCYTEDGNGNRVPFFGTDGNLYQPGADLPDGVEPAGLNNDGDCNDSEDGERPVVDPVAIGGVAKQAADGKNLPYTTTDDTVVDGYNAFNCQEIRQFDDWYLPIVQTNCGPGGCWNSIIRVANNGQVSDSGTFGGGPGAAAVTIRFFPADDGSGSLQEGFQIETLLNVGDTWNVDLSEYVPDGWVGSAHVYSDSAVSVMTDRYKAGEYKMWLTTTGTNPYHQSAEFDPPDARDQEARYVLFAPDVRLDYYGWNSGINVANLANEDNNVNIQYFNRAGNANQTLTQRLAPHGMTYFYDPSQAGQNNSSPDYS